MFIIFVFLLYKRIAKEHHMNNQSKIKNLKKKASKASSSFLASLYQCDQSTKFIQKFKGMLHTTTIDNLS